MSRLDDLGVVLPRLGLGAAALGNLFSVVGDEQSRTTVDAAWNGGVRHFDVAPHYGLGLAERRLGQALAGRPREAYTLSTKVGRRLAPSPETAHECDDHGFVVPADHRRVWDVSPAGLRLGLADSLDRLGVDAVDIVYLHDPDENVPAGSSLEAVLADALPALAELRDDGLVRAVGVGSKSTEALVRSASSGLVDVVMVAGRHNLLERTAGRELLPVCGASGVDVVAVGVYASGALAAALPRRDLPYEYGPVPDAVFERIQQLSVICRSHGVDLPTAALQFPLRHPAVSSVVVGARSAAEVVELLRRWAVDVPAVVWAELDDAPATGIRDP